MEHIVQTCFSLAAASDASAGTADAAAPEAASDESCVFLGVRAWGAGWVKMWLSSRCKNGDHRHQYDDGHGITAIANATTNTTILVTAPKMPSSSRDMKKENALCWVHGHESGWRGEGPLPSQRRGWMQLGRRKGIRVSDVGAVRQRWWCNENKLRTMITLDGGDRRHKLPIVRRIALETLCSINKRKTKRREKMKQDKKEAKKRRWKDTKCNTIKMRPLNHKPEDEASAGAALGVCAVGAARKKKGSGEWLWGGRQMRRR
jgi:hypothetical protein